LLAGWVAVVMLGFTWRSFESFDTPKEALIKMGVAVLGALVLSGWLLGGRIRIVWHPLLFAALAFWGWGWVSLAVSHSPFTIRAQLFTLHLLLPIILAPVLLFREGDLERFWAGVAVAGGVVAAIAVGQWFGLDYEQGLRIVPLQASAPKTEIYSTIGNPNYLAAVLAFLLPVTIALAAGAPRPAAHHSGAGFFHAHRSLALRSILLWGCAALSAIALMMSRSKGGLAAAIVGAIVLWQLWSARHGWSGRRRFFFGMGGLGLAIALSALMSWQGLALGSEWHKLLNLSWDDPSVKGRLLMWRTTLEMVKDHPIIGIGTGAFGPQYQAYRARVFDRLDDPATLYPAREHSYDEAGHAHNDWLQLAAENGLVGLALFMVLIGGVYVTGLRLLNKRVPVQEMPLPPPPSTPQPLDPLPSHLLCGLLAGFSALLLHALVDFPLHQPVAILLFWLVFMTVVAAGGGLKMWPLPDWFATRVVRWAGTGVAVLVAGLLMVQATRPIAAGVHQQRAWQLMNGRQWAAAVPAIEAGLQWDPISPALLLYLGVARFEQGDLTGSRAAYERYQLLYSDFQTLYNLGLIAVRERRFDQAERDFLEALRYKPTLAEAAAALALVAEQTGRADDARRYRRQAVQLRNASA
jgi:O-antigen ligase